MFKKKNPTATVTINGRDWMLNASKIKNELRCPLSTFLFNVILEALASAVQQ